MNLSRYIRYTTLCVSKGERYFRRRVAGRMARSEYAFLPQDLRWLMRRALILLGWPGMAAIGLLVACAVFYFSSVLQAQYKLVSVHHSSMILQDQLDHAGRGTNTDRRSPEEQVAQFYKLFPQDKDLPQCMEKIFASAQSHGIELEKGEYKVSRDKQGGVVRFQMIFPVKGDYPSIRKYLTSLMADIPTLSLQQVQFKRQNVGDALVEANIKFVLYLLEPKS